MEEEKKVKENVKKKNLIINILTIINICIIIVLVFNIAKNQMYPRKYIKELWESNSNCKNYIITINCTDYINEDFSYQQTITCKDDRYKEEYQGQDGNYRIRWHIENKVISETAKVIVYNNSGYIYTLTNWQGLEIINNTNAKYRFVKLEEYNGKQCIVVEFEYEEEQSNLKLEYQNMTQKWKFWIDKETGIILKTLEFNKYSEILKKYEYTAEINCVTDSDMIFPNTDGYEIVDQRSDD